VLCKRRKSKISKVKTEPVYEYRNAEVGIEIIYESPIKLNLPSDGGRQEVYQHTNAAVNELHSFDTQEINHIYHEIDSAGSIYQVNEEIFHTKSADIEDKAQGKSSVNATAKKEIKNKENITANSPNSLSIPEYNKEADQDAKKQSQEHVVRDEYAVVNKSVNNRIKLV